MQMTHADSISTRPLHHPGQSIRATMSIVDSETVFRSRGLHTGVTDAVLDLFKNAGITTMGNLAFASSYVPGAADDGRCEFLLRNFLLFAHATFLAKHVPGLIKVSERGFAITRCQFWFLLFKIVYKQTNQPQQRNGCILCFVETFPFKGRVGGFLPFHVEAFSAFMWGY